MTNTITQSRELPIELNAPVSADVILRNRAALRQKLLNRPGLLEKRVAILGGSTTAEIAKILELFLLAEGIRPLFYQSGYNKYDEDVLFESRELWDFRPDIAFIHTTWHNVSCLPAPLRTEAEIEQALQREVERFVRLWDKLQGELGALVIQNNFDLPRLRPLGNLEASEPFCHVNYLLRLNAEFARHTRGNSRVFINDMLYLSARIGLDRWFDYTYWYAWHSALTPTATVAVAQNVASMIKSIYGKSRKCLVLDLDNTLWGGVIGDDGLQNLVLGRDHPVGEAFLAFQRYAKNLRERGILLAVCSKNDFENARMGFSHPDSILTLEDFSAFKANWNPKSDNLREIAAELNIGLDSLVFVDDNPAERSLVAAHLPEVAVPEVGSDVCLFPEIIDRAGYFEAVSLTREDLVRTALYSGNSERAATQSQFASYGEFLDSLEMRAEIRPFAPIYLERITQLISKTNQFNLTTRRYTAAEVVTADGDPSCISLYGRLADRFGDNGLVSVIMGSVHAATLQIDVWLMSCRVLKREMEHAMFDVLVEHCRVRRISKLLGIYIPSAKNGMVSGHYGELGFTKTSEESDGGTRWEFDLSAPCEPKNNHIRISNNAMSATAVV